MIRGLRACKRFLSTSSALPRFHSFSIEERNRKLCEFAGLSESDGSVLMSNGLPIETAANMIENVVGKFELPLGIATNFIVNNKDHLIPMVVEEPSIVAAASKIAKLARATGGFHCSSTPPVMIGQVHVTKVSDPFAAKARLLQAKEELVDLANQQDPMLIKAGGGARDIEVRILDSPLGPLVILHLLVDCRDAMGANAVNTMVEAIAPRIEEICEGKAYLKILSNLAIHRRFRALATFRAADLGGPDVVEGIIQAYNFASVDPFRAATHNKGIFNGIDPVIIATGNDWRAVEAGGHAWASMSGKYSPLTCWERNKSGDLVGSIELPLAIGLIGGACKTHPAAHLCVEILGIKSVAELGHIVAAVGLAQNLGAIRALSTEGIQRGHMALHAKNMISAAASNLGIHLIGKNFDEAVRRLVSSRTISADKAHEVVCSALIGSAKIATFPGIEE